MMQVIDAHHHLWNPDSNTPPLGYKWLKEKGLPKPFGNPEPIQRDYLLPEFRSEAGAEIQLSASVHVQADGAIPDPVAETKFIQAISDEAQFFIGIVGFVDLSRDDADQILYRHKESKNFRGVRQILTFLDDRPDLSYAKRDLTADPLWRQQFALLDKHQQLFELQMYPEQTKKVVDVLSHHKRIPVIIDHSGSPYDTSSTGMACWEESMRQLAALPQTSIKVSGLAMFDYRFNENERRLWQEHVIGTILTIFGPQRTMYGSNFPVDKLYRNYDATLAVLSQQLNRYSEADKKAVFFDNAKRIYRVSY